MQNEQIAQQNALKQMFESTQQETQSVKQAFKSLLENISEADKTRNSNIGKLLQQVNSLSEQVQSLERQVIHLKK